MACMTALTLGAVTGVKRLWDLSRLRTRPSHSYCGHSSRLGRSQVDCGFLDEPAGTTFLDPGPSLRLIRDAAHGALTLDVGAAATSVCKDECEGGLDATELTQNFVESLTDEEAATLDGDVDLGDLYLPLAAVLRCHVDFGNCALELTE